ncbi:MAG: hypothetical protein IJV18_10335 [Acidaminococcaceae bacterium]|nr:hypothetical protein [Acidaminococcaceae bacterium]
MEAVLPNPKTALGLRLMKVSSLLFRNAIKAGAPPDESLAPDVTMGPVNQSNTNNSWRMEPILFNFILYTKTK